MIRYLECVCAASELQLPISESICALNKAIAYAAADLERVDLFQRGCIEGFRLVPVDQVQKSARNLRIFHSKTK